MIISIINSRTATMSFKKSIYDDNELKEKKKQLIGNDKMVSTVLRLEIYIRYGLKSLRG
jgi:hypothetical protein